MSECVRKSGIPDTIQEQYREHLQGLLTRGDTILIVPKCQHSDGPRNLGGCSNSYLILGLSHQTINISNDIAMALDLVYDAVYDAIVTLNSEQAILIIVSLARTLWPEDTIAALDYVWL